MKNIFKVLLVGALFTLAGCQTPLIHGVNAVVNAAADMPETMIHKNLSAMVAFDEDWVGRYPFTVRNQLYVMGVESGEPEYGMRIVKVNVRHPEWGGWYRAGEKVWWTAAAVPDTVPTLKAGDLVEIRQSGDFRVLRNFAKTNDGNVILRILCRKADADYVQCAEKLPRIGTYIGFGETGTLYPESVKEYGFTFTPKYDADGKPLR